MPHTKLSLQTPDTVTANVERIRTLFPNCVTETHDAHGQLTYAVDFDQLRQELSGQIVEGPKERYQLTWPGKRQAILTANAPIRKTLRPARAESVDFDTTQNLFIEGDNLDALKLLQETYLGKVKMIYIDPPYNTGKDFVYKDNFAQSTQEYLEQSGQKDDEGNRMEVNSDSNGRYHSDWISFLYPRIKISRNLLSEDGIIAISIDDNEVDNLKQVCSELFGASNFVANIVWQKKYGPANDSSGVSETHEHVMLFAKNANVWLPALLPRDEKQLAAYKNPDNDPRGVWRASDLSVRTKSDNCMFPIAGPDGQIHYPPNSTSWRINEVKFNEMLADNRITFGTSNTGRPMQKKFLTEVKGGITPQTWWPRAFAEDTKIARYQMKDLIPENVFDTPKPTGLIKRLIGLHKGPDIVLDFFAGSGTTGHAVMKLNAEDGGTRKYICVQLPEVTDEKSEARKAGYPTIAEITKERLRRAGRKIKEEHPDWQGDTGFRVLKIDSTCMKDVYYAPAETRQSELELFVDNIKADRSAEDLLFQVMIDLGVPLDLAIAVEPVEGVEVYSVAGGALVACFAERLTESVVKAIAQRRPDRMVFRDSAFGRDSEKINAEQIRKHYAPESVLRVV